MNYCLFSGSFIQGCRTPLMVIWVTHKSPAVVWKLMLLQSPLLSLRWLYYETVSLGGDSAMFTELCKRSRERPVTLSTVWGKGKKRTAEESKLLLHMALAVPVLVSPGYRTPRDKLLLFISPLAMAFCCLHYAVPTQHSRQCKTFEWKTTFFWELILLWFLFILGSHHSSQWLKSCVSLPFTMHNAGLLASAPVPLKFTPALGYWIIFLMVSPQGHDWLLHS